MSTTCAAGLPSISHEEVLRLENVTAGYRTSTLSLGLLARRYNIVLRNVNLAISSGERVAIVGESGAGKTTLAKVVLGLLKPLKGEVYLLGKPLYKLSWRARVKLLRNIGYVPQDPYKALNPSLKVIQILMEQLEALKLSSESALTRIQEVLDLVKLPKSVLDKTPTDLSGGMRQRVLIARALVGRPCILLLDEPTSSLDVSIQAQIINLLNDVQRRLGITMITISHDLSVVQYLADRLIVLKNGQVVEDGMLDELIASPRSNYFKTIKAEYDELTKDFIQYTLGSAK